MISVDYPVKLLLPSTLSSNSAEIRYQQRAGDIRTLIARYHLSIKYPNQNRRFRYLKGCELGNLAEAVMSARQ